MAWDGRFRQEAKQSLQSFLSSVKINYNFMGSFSSLISHTTINLPANLLRPKRRDPQILQH